MARYANDAVMDAALAYVADNGIRMDICATQPTTYAEATTTKSLGNITLTAGAGAGDYILANGDTSGRKLTVTAQSNISVGTTGTADHLAITNGVDTLIYVTTLTSQAVTSGNTADTSAWDIEIADPTA